MDALGDASKSLTFGEESAAVERLFKDAQISNSNSIGRQMVPGLLLIGGRQNKQIDSPLITNTLAVTGSNETQLPHPPKACYSCVIFCHFSYF